MRTRTILAIAAVVLVCGGIPGAQETVKPAPADAKKKGPETVAGRADFMKSVWGNEKTVLMRGNVKFTHGDTVLTCDEVQYDQTARIAVSPGRIVITDPECDITGDKGTAYFKKRIGVIEGNVTMLVKPKKAEEEPADKNSVRAKLKQPTTVTCEKLEYNYRTKIASATGGVSLKQEKRSATAQKLIYDEKNEIITLIGDVKGIDEDGQTFSAPDKVVISVKKGAEWMEAPNASATFKVETQEETPE